MCTKVFGSDPFGRASRGLTQTNSTISCHSDCDYEGLIGSWSIFMRMSAFEAKLSYQKASSLELFKLGLNSYAN